MAKRTAPVFLCVFLFVSLFAVWTEADELRYGMEGDEVLELQTRLADLGYFNGPLTGFFGEITEEAVYAYQQDKGLIVDGWVGDQTRTSLFAGTVPVETETSEQANPDAAVLPQYTAYVRELYYGTSGSEVFAMQERLTALGYTLGNIDGDFGTMTETAVYQFQRDRGLVMDGLVGPLTWAALFESSSAAPAEAPAAAAEEAEEAEESSASAVYTRDLYFGSYGDDVSSLQRILSSMGYAVGVIDGDFGPMTENAVIAYQQDRGLVADGVVGPITFADLFGGTVVYDAEEPEEEDYGSYGIDYSYGIEYANSLGNLTEAQRQTVISAFSMPTTAAGLCAGWVRTVLDDAGVYNTDFDSLRDSEYSYAYENGLTTEEYEYDTDFNANDYWAYICDSDNRDDLEPGMVVATRSSYTYLGRQFGHVGIYVGNNSVLSSIGTIEQLSLDDFSEKYNNTDYGSTIRWGFAPLIN